MDIQDFNSKNRNKMVDRVVQKKIDSLTESYLDGNIELDESATLEDVVAKVNELIGILKDRGITTV